MLPTAKPNIPAARDKSKLSSTHHADLQPGERPSFQRSLPTCQMSNLQFGHFEEWPWGGACTNPPLGWRQSHLGRAGRTANDPLPFRLRLVLHWPGYAAGASEKGGSGVWGFRTGFCCAPSSVLSPPPTPLQRLSKGSLLQTQLRRVELPCATAQSKRFPDLSPVSGVFGSRFWMNEHT